MLGNENETNNGARKISATVYYSTMQRLTVHFIVSSIASWCFDIAQAGEALTVTDPNEAWVFHVLSDDTTKVYIRSSMHYNRLDTPSRLDFFFFGYKTSHG